MLLIICLFIDINECLNAGICGDEHCINTAGNYTCNKCAAGFIAVNNLCIGTHSHFFFHSPYSLFLPLFLSPANINH